MESTGENLLRKRTSGDGKTLENDDETGEIKTENVGASHRGRDVNTNCQNQAESAHTGPYRSAAEYSLAVQQWLWQYHMWNQMHWFHMNFPFYACNMGRFPGSPQQFSPNSSTYNFVPPGFPSQMPGYSPHVTQPPPPNIPGAAAAGTRANTSQNARGAATPNESNQRGQEFKVPPLWKRVFAEFIDFFLLFVVKLAVTIFFVEYIGLVDLRHYDLEFLMTTDMDYNTAFAMTSELIAMEIVNRVFICVFETLCLRQGLARNVGGTTPGKRMMGLKVISCREIIDVPGNKVRIIPAGNIGTWNAFVRSLIKNFSLAFFFPVCLTVFFFQHNRAAYDIIANCVVVEATEPVARWR